MLLTDFNQASSGQAAEVLTRCAPIPSWVTAVAAGRPFRDAAALQEAADTAARVWTRDEVAAALADHPRIGERRAGADHLSQLSEREQAGVSRAADVAQRLLEGNQAYEARFGHVFLIRAAGRDQDEILAELERRMDNDEAAEWAETADQLRQIALVRLRDQVVDPA